MNNNVRHTTSYPGAHLARLGKEQRKQLLQQLATARLARADRALGAASWRECDWLGIAAAAAWRGQGVEDAPSQARDNVSRLRTELRKQQAERVLGHISPALRTCGRMPIYAVGAVTLTAADSPGHIARVSGVASCGNVHACPCCAAREQARRTHVVRWYADRCIASGGDVVLGLLTIPHTVGDDWGTSVQRLLHAWRKIWSGRWRDSFCARYGIVGLFRAVEATHGAHGLHPHMHYVMLLEKPLDSAMLQSASMELLSAWRTYEPDAVAQANGMDVARCGARAADYVARGVYSMSRARWLRSDAYEQQASVVHARTESVRAMVLEAAMPGAKEGTGIWGWLDALIADPNDNESRQNAERYLRAFKGRRTSGWIRKKEIVERYGEPEEWHVEQASGQQMPTLEIPPAEWREWVRMGVDRTVRIWAACPWRLASYSGRVEDIPATAIQWLASHGVTTTRGEECPTTATDGKTPARRVYQLPRVP